MNDENVIEEIVAKFFLNTCRPRPQLSRPAVEAALHCVRMTGTQPCYDVKTHFITLITGSVAEFYLEPMLPHIGDIDVMFHCSTDLVIPRGHPPPTHLPAEFHSCVRVCEIIDKVGHITDSYSPGYVYPEPRYLLTECVDDGKYNAVEYDLHWYKIYRVRFNDKSSVHGLADSVVYGASLLSVDRVRCMRCLVWPPQAADWPTRRRNYGWPDSSIIDRVISNGCDVVGVAHRRCRTHKDLSEKQFRLSFSRAEIVLINSWMPVQQIVYHMLRVFMKTERLTDSANNTVADSLSNYHIKTLMLWACELKPRIWWTYDLSLVRVCVELLHYLAVWLIDARCPNYFVSNCNLLDSSCNSEMIGSLLMSVNSSWLSLWCVDNYIRRCSQLCPPSVSRLFDDVSSVTELENAVSAIINWRQNTALLDRWTAFSCACYYIAVSVSHYDLTAWRIDFALTELRKTSTSLPVYLSSASFLHVAYRTTRSALNDTLMEVLAVLVGQSVVPRRNSSRPRSVLLLNKAVNLMKTVDRSESRSTTQLVMIELCKAYLYTALSCEDSDSDSVYCLANVYLAVLYYATGQYQPAIDYCTLVMRSQDHSQCSSCVLQELLLKIDDNFDTVLGIAVLYQHIRITALNRQQQQQTHVTLFTTETIAHYLHIRCMTITKCHQLDDTAKSQSSTYEVNCHLKYIAEAQQLFIADVLLWKIVNIFYKPTIFNKQQTISRQSAIRKCPSKLNTTHLVELLQKSAVEHLTVFRQAEAQEFDSLTTIVTTDFEALYVYKRGDYQRSLQLSTQNVRQLLYAVRMSHVPTYPEFLQLLDDDIVSLTALTLIVNPKCRDADNKNSHVFIT